MDSTFKTKRKRGGNAWFHCCMTKQNKKEEKVNNLEGREIYTFLLPNICHISEIKNSRHNNKVLIHIFFLQIKK